MCISISLNNSSGEMFIHRPISTRPSLSLASSAMTTLLTIDVMVLNRYNTVSFPTRVVKTDQNGLLVDHFDPYIIIS